MKLSGDCGKDLEEARDILEFQNEVRIEQLFYAILTKLFTNLQVEKLSQFLREREALVLANDLGE